MVITFFLVRSKCNFVLFTLWEFHYWSLKAKRTQTFLNTVFYTILSVIRKKLQIPKQQALHTANFRTLSVNRSLLSLGKRRPPFHELKQIFKGIII